MLTREMIQEANQGLPTIDAGKGKQYVMVHTRIRAFRDVMPGGSIVTEILHLDEEKVVMKATITDDEGQIIATGIASEKFNSSFITKTSAFEVCETSAIGRALGIAGIGIDASMASAEEVANAILQQGEEDLASEKEKAQFREYCIKLNQDPQEILKKTGWKRGQKMTKEQHGRALIILMEIEKAKEEE